MKLDRLTLEYSNLYKHAACQVKISPNTQYIANAVDTRLVIRAHSQDLTILMVYESVKPIDYIEWAPNSEYILSVNYEHARVDVWSTVDTNWHGLIKDPRIELMVRLKWSSDSKSIIYTSDLKLFSGVWNLSTGELKLIQHIKYSDKGIETSPDGKYVAIAEKRSGKDYIGLYLSSSFIFIQGFEVNTVDFQNFKWSPDSTYIAVWDNCIYHKLLVYRQDGELCTTYVGYKNNLGIKTVQWSPSGNMIAIGNYDQTIHLISTLSWELIGILEHPTTLTSNMDTNIVEEINLPISTIPTLATALVEYRHVEKRPYVLPTIRADNNTPYPKIGIQSCLFSTDEKYLFSRNENMPNVLWFWQMKTLQCSSAIVFQHPIRHISWNPQEEHMLMVVCGNENIHFIQPTENDALEMIPLRVPISDFSIKKFQWNSSGESVILMDQDLFCLTLF